MMQDALPAGTPMPPQNGQAVTTYINGSTDIRWDDPKLISYNSNLDILGVHVYRSESSDRGPYIRISESPVGGCVFRDANSFEWVEEQVQAYLGHDPVLNRWYVKTSRPIVKPYSTPRATPTYADNPYAVLVKTLNGQRVNVRSVLGSTGEVELVNLPELDQRSEKWDTEFEPIDQALELQVSYWASKVIVPVRSEGPVWYRVTTVAANAESVSGYVETPLDYCKPLSTAITEANYYAWAEAVRRNSWILQQGGERVKIFIRKTAGVECNCNLDPREREYAKQPRNSCTRCYGTGFVGGYEGPYETIIAPDDADRRLTLMSMGQRKDHTYEVFCGPTPVLTQRDFLVKQTGERFSIGAIRRPSNSGMILQQHFTIGFFDDPDIRYRVPMAPPTDLPWPETRDSLKTVPMLPITGVVPEPVWPVGPTNTHPMLSEKSNVPDGVEQRGRTRVWENINQ